MGKSIFFRRVTGWASNDKIFRAIGAATAQRNDMIDMKPLAYLDVTIIAMTLLCFILALYICTRMCTFRISLERAPFLNQGIHPFWMGNTPCAVSLDYLVLIGYMIKMPLNENIGLVLFVIKAFLLSQGFPIGRTPKAIMLGKIRLVLITPPLIQFLNSLWMGSFPLARIVGTRLFAGLASDALTGGDTFLARHSVFAIERRGTGFAIAIKAIRGSLRRYEVFQRCWFMLLAFGAYLGWGRMRVHQKLNFLVSNPGAC